MINEVNNEFYKFIIVGVVNSLFWYLIFSLFILLEYSYYIAVFAATTIGILFNFNLAHATEKKVKIN